jgi:UPF0755 protein
MDTENASPINDISRETITKLNKPQKIGIGFCAVLAFLVFFNFFFLSAPSDFPIGGTFEIGKGMSLRKVSGSLKNENFIRSRTVFEALVILRGGEGEIRQSTYSFEGRLPVYEVARRILRGDHRTPPVVVTVPEGFDVAEIADLIVTKLSNFDRSKFLGEAQNHEGYLFPDTYFFFTDADEDDVVGSMQRNFEKKIAPLRRDIESSGRSERDIITMASLIEGEAKGELDRATISGILWKRLDRGIALQVDVAPITYKERGLPESPIGNPGLASIEASIHPESSPYLYYLHDKEGEIYYAKSFAEHQKNISRYLR